VPASRMKGGREHRVPLSGQAVELLEALPRTTSASSFAWISSGMKINPRS
jgi:integrase